MKTPVFLVLLSASVTIYSQNNGMFIEGVPYNQNQHFMFSMSSDTIINGYWTQLANYPRPLFGVNCYYWPATGKIFTCGGATVQGIPQKACYFYNPLSNSYETADSLPAGRWSGKLVRIKDSLYLIGSANVFTSADGATYKYFPALNHWVEKDSMPLPRLHEPAVCVFRDTLVVCIGGSTSTFAVPTNIIRTYNPYKNKWKTIGSFPITTTTGHAEYNPNDSTIVVVGGYGTTFINVIYRGKVNSYNFQTDTLDITWSAAATTDSTIFHTGIYRVGGGKAGDWMLFGPALRNSSTYNTIYSITFANVNNNLEMFWYRMIPNVPDSAGNRPTLAVNVVNDSAYVYLFSGSVGLTTVNTSYKYSFALPIPVGLKQISQSIPQRFKLYQNFPNPFNPATKIRFSIPFPDEANAKRGSAVFVKVVVYDILGREIAVLVSDSIKPGDYEVSWNAVSYPSGIYFYRLDSNYFSDTKKMILIK